MSKELGTLVVVVLKARNLIDKHSFYKSDVYAQISLNGTTKRTPVDVKGGQHPVWDAELRFPVMKDTAAKFRNLQVSCWSKEPRTDESLGEGKVDISETLKTGEFDDWVALSTEAGVRGEVYLEMTYYSAAPLPSSNRLSTAPGAELLRRPSKLSPVDRLSRPAQPSPLSISGSNATHPDRNHQDNSSLHRNHLVPGPGAPPPPRSSSTSPKRPDGPRLDDVSSTQSTIPSTLLPGAGRAKPSAQPASTTLPSILRPGNPNISPTRTPVPQAVPSQQPTLPPHIPGSPVPHYSVPIDAPRPASYTPVPGTTYTEPHITPHSQASAGYVSPVPPPSSPVPSAVPEQWAAQAASVPLSFPLPIISSVKDNFGYNPLTRGPRPSDNDFTPITYKWGGDERDLYLQTRYQTPLPLPPGSSANSRQAPAEGRRSPTDAARLEALREAEREAARRKEQEEKDLELARQLDRELNL